MTAGISGAVMSFLTTKVLNPFENLKPSDPEMYERVPLIFKALAIYFAINTLIAGIIQPETYESPELKEALEIKKLEKKSKDGSMIGKSVTVQGSQ